MDAEGFFHAGFEIGKLLRLAPADDAFERGVVGTQLLGSKLVVELFQQFAQAVRVLEQVIKERAQRDGRGITPGMDYRKSRLDRSDQPSPLKSAETLLRPSP